MAVYVTHQERTWMNSDLLSKWIDLMFPAVLGSWVGRGLMWNLMRAHISKDVKAKCVSKKIKTMVILGGLTPYRQAGDIEIFKSFKDCLSSVIDEWNQSDRVLYAKSGNLRPLSVEEVVAWVSNSWKSVPNEVVQRSIAAAGFADDYRDWHISKHDVYGGLFQSKWVSADEESSDELDGVDLADEFDELFVE